MSTETPLFLISELKEEARFTMEKTQSSILGKAPVFFSTDVKHLIQMQVRYLTMESSNFLVLPSL